MKNFIVANLSFMRNFFPERRRLNFDKLENMIKAQIENSLELGWKISDIILLSNFNYEFMGIKSVKTKLNHKCLIGSKIFGIKYLFDNNLVDEEEIVWAHDLDAWQNIWFEIPDIKDVGITYYNTDKFNGGSIFWRRNAIDIINKIVEKIVNEDLDREEPALNEILKSDKYKDRVSIINRTFNLGCSGYVKRWKDSIKPIHVCHFNPEEINAWETYVLDSHALEIDGLDRKGLSIRLEKILRKYYNNFITELRPETLEKKKKRIDNKKNYDIMKGKL